MEWYQTLTINQRITLKDFYPLVVGASFHELGRLFTLRQRIEIIYEKLKLEGFKL